MPTTAARPPIFATVVIGDDRYHVTIEPFPAARGVWEWVIWRLGDTRRTAKFGHAPSALSATLLALAALAN